MGERAPGWGEWWFRDKTLRAGEGHDWARHRGAVLTLVVFGRLDEGFPRGVQSCRPFELHYKPPGVPHTTSTGLEGVRMLLLGLQGRAARYLGIREPACPTTLPGGRRAARVFSDLLALEALDGTDDTSWMDRIRRLGAILDDDGAQRAASRRPTWITEVYEQVVGEGWHRRSLGQLGAAFGVHPVYLARAFRSHYGVTIGELRRRLRVERAISSLRSGRETLAEVALELGYSDQSHLTRDFKRETGWTPGRFQAAAGPLARLGGNG